MAADHTGSPNKAGQLVDANIPRTDSTFGCPKPNTIHRGMVHTGSASCRFLNLASHSLKPKGFRWLMTCQSRSTTRWVADFHLIRFGIVIPTILS